MSVITDRLGHMLPRGEGGTAKEKVSEVGQEAQKVRHSRAFRSVARIGLAARALVYLMLGGLIIEIAVRGHASSAADSQGALAEFARQPGGTGILEGLAAGLFAYALWRIVEALSRAPEGQHVTAWTRAGWVVVGALYIALGVNSLRLSSGAAPSHNPSQHPASLARRVLAWPLGPELLGLVAAAVAAAAIGLMVWGTAQNYSKWLRTARMGPGSTMLVRISGAVGNLARGLGVLLVAVWLFVSALSDDPTHAKSLDAALHALAGTPGGPPILFAIGLGFVSFCIHSAMEACFRRV